MDSDERATPRIIPGNATDTGRVLNGVFKKQNLIEAVVITVPVAFLLWNLIPISDWQTKVPYVVIPSGALFALGVFGIPPYSLFEYVNLFIKFRRTKHYAKYNPKLKWDETVPEFLINLNYETFYDKIGKILDGITNSNIQEENPVDENILNPKHIEKFKDDIDEKELKKLTAKEEKEMRKRLKERERSRNKSKRR